MKKVGEYTSTATGLSSFFTGFMVPETTTSSRLVLSSCNLKFNERLLSLLMLTFFF